uniref:Erythropoietin n=1 Tax=Taeniopygia guttata TaxID=59729 RepID=A0A674GPI5_TAEGU
RSPRPPGLCAALLLLLLGVPGRPQPPPETPPSLCDPRVIERFILEAREAERGAAGCGPHCDLPEPVAVPDPGVNFNFWRSLDVSGNGARSRAREVAAGQAALAAAVLRAREQLRDPRVRPSLDRAHGAARSLARLLRGGSGGDFGTFGGVWDFWGVLGGFGDFGGDFGDFWGSGADRDPAPPQAPPTPLPPPGPVRVRNVPRLLGVLSRFLRGKVRLFLTDTVNHKSSSPRPSPRHVARAGR